MAGEDDPPETGAASVFSPRTLLGPYVFCGFTEQRRWLASSVPRRSQNHPPGRGGATPKAHGLSIPSVVASFMAMLPTGCNDNNVAPDGTTGRSGSVEDSILGRYRQAYAAVAARPRSGEVSRGTFPGIQLHPPARCRITLRRAIHGCGPHADRLRRRLLNLALTPGVRLGNHQQPGGRNLKENTAGVKQRRWQPATQRRTLLPLRFKDAMDGPPSTSFFSGAAPWACSVR